MQPPIASKRNPNRKVYQILCKKSTTKFKIRKDDASAILAKVSWFIRFSEWKWMNDWTDPNIYLIYILWIVAENNDESVIVQGLNASNSTNSIDDNAIYKKLSISSRNLAKNISSMGFPLEQVARIMEKLGKDDKKVCRFCTIFNPRPIGTDCFIVYFLFRCRLLST